MTDSLRLDPTLTVWSADPADIAGKPLLVLLHGYGADENDLFGLRSYLPEGIVVAALAAPLSPPWPMPGRSWYPIEGLEGRDGASITAAAGAVIAWIDEHAAAAAKVGLLGFSQGGAVSLQALRRDPHRFACAINLSGYVADDPEPADAELSEAKPPVFWGRGTHDEVIPAARIAHTVQWLPTHVDLTGQIYPGLGHSISEAELVDVRAFVQRHLLD